MKNRFFHELLKLARICLILFSVALIVVAGLLLFLPQVFFEILRYLIIAICIVAAVCLIASLISLAISVGKTKKKDKIG